MQAVRRRILKSENEDAMIFFDSFLGDHFIEEIKPNFRDGWDGLVNAGDYDQLYPLVAEILFDAATRNHSEGHVNIYKDASAVSLAFCEELNEVFQCSGNETFIFIPIRSFSEMMIKSGHATSSAD